MDIFFYILLAISHLQFSLGSTKYRFNKVFVYCVYGAFALFFLGICFTPLPLAAKFGITFIVNLVLYLFISSGNVVKKLFLLSTYLVIFTIFFGAFLSIDRIKEPELNWIKWIAVIIAFALIQCITYFILIPRFYKVEKSINKGWTRLIVGNLLFFAALFAQSIYPFKISEGDPLRIIIFVLTSLAYMFSFELAFYNFKTIIDINKKEEERVQLQEMAYTDGLTSLLNKTAYDAHCKDLMNIYEKEPTLASCVIVMDINKFKKINDTYGHLEGDEVLKQVANCIKAIFKDDNFIPFRIGGDEFVVLGIHVNEELINEKIEAFNHEISLKSKVKVSLGYEFVDFNDIDPIRTAFKNADKNMYKSKFHKKISESDKVIN